MRRAGFCIEIGAIPKFPTGVEEADRVGEAGLGTRRVGFE